MLSSGTGSSGGDAAVQSFSDVSYLDDDAYCIWDKGADQLLAEIPTLVAVVVQCFAGFGFCLNFAAGKSEASVILRGSWSRRLRKQLFIDQSAVIQCNTMHGPQVLRVVQPFVHLGIAVARDSLLGPEVARRAAAANAAFAILSRQVFGRPDLEESAKIKALGAFVDARLFYNVATWHPPRSIAAMEKVRRRVACRILRRKVDWRVFDADLFAAVHLLGFDDYLRRRRLVYLCRLLCHGPPLLHSMVYLASGFSGSWASFVALDLQHLFVHDKSFAGLTDPLVDCNCWLQFIVADLDGWLRRIDAQYRTVIQKEQAAAQLRVAQRWVANAVRHGIDDDDTIVADLAGRCGQFESSDSDEELMLGDIAVKYPHRCTVCGSLAQSLAALGLHKRAPHGILPQCRMFAQGSRRISCNTEFHSRPRLIRHFRRVPACLQVVAEGTAALSIEAVGEFEAADARSRIQAQEGRALYSGSPSIVPCLAIVLWSFDRR